MAVEDLAIDDPVIPEPQPDKQVKPEPASDSIDDLLAQYDAATKSAPGNLRLEGDALKKKDVLEAEYQKGDEDLQAFLDDLERNPPNNAQSGNGADNSRDRPPTYGDGLDEFQSQYGTNGNQDPRIDALAAQVLERLDMENCFKYGQNLVNEINPNLPDNFAQMWLINEYSFDPMLKRAWDNRYQDEGALDHANRVMEKKYRKLAKQASSLPDPDLTTDKFAVTDAMKSAFKAAPPEKPVDWSGMSNEEFKRLSKQKFGFDSPVE